ncbi:BZ3500_MvSof-1268-A1-R1_Chr12-3g03982 [Microbotryum saponariae]|uniref:BZ3500_MvSof-1268-A1-R1_Chr12-3g03982 protein n=1 Tax=Microbotryum saponariae TaxID=289078 RepID=A0A2X0KLT9_9BASI|nr:BZ3500_MvSof-1268-A1-R1_Chr12-3g03982 [Microbotryum saponariae]
MCTVSQPVHILPLPPPRHRQLAITALMFHRPSRASPMHDARIFPPPPRLPAPEGRWGKVVTIASTSAVCYSIFCWNVHHFRMRPPL